MKQHTQAWSPPKATLQITNGAQHVRDVPPPADWKPPEPVGFAPPERDPQTWDGDQA